jgi:hypothetical protein
MDRLTEERIAANNAQFRDANEHIRRAAEVHEVATGVPFICECPDPTCMDIVRLDLDDYRAVRANARWFLKAPSHELEPGPAARVVREAKTHYVVETTGRAGEVAEALAGEGRTEE